MPTPVILRPAAARALRVRGFSLIEVLVALVVFSVGALAVAGLQVRALKAQQMVESRSTAAALLADLADRIRANPTASLAGQYAYTADSYTVQRTAMDAASKPAADKDCAADSCTAAELASADLVNWRLSLDRRLPASVGLVQGDAIKGYTVTVAWYDKDWRKPAGGTEQSAVCKATTPTTADAANAAALTLRTCCPKSLGDPVGAGVRCLSALVRP